MIRINLLKPEKKEAPRRDETAYFAEEKGPGKLNIYVAVGALVLTLGTIGGAYFLQDGRLKRETQLLEDSRARLAELEKELKLLADAQKTAAEVERKIKIINDLKAQQQNAMLMMDKLSVSLPDWVWLTKTVFHQFTLNIEGKAISNNLIVDLINNLSNSGYFENVQLETSVRKQEAGMDIFDFKIRCTFKRASEPQKAV